MPKQPKQQAKDQPNQSFLSKVKSKLPWTKKPAEQSNVVQEPSANAPAGTPGAATTNGIPAANQLPAEPTPAQVPSAPKAQ